MFRITSFIWLILFRLVSLAAESNDTTPPSTAPVQSTNALTLQTNEVPTIETKLTPTNTTTITSIGSTTNAPTTNTAAIGLTTNTIAQTTNVANVITNASMDALDDKHKLAIGDRLSFRIEEDLEEPKPMMVTDSGGVEAPYIGRVKAENKTCKQLAGDIKAELEKEFYYQATVIIAVDLRSKSRGKVYLVGPVRMPGPQEIPSDEVLTLSKAILRAGGFNDYADRKHVKITRQGSSGDTDKKTFVVDVAQIYDKGKTENDVPLEPGDLILIPERLIRF